MALRPRHAIDLFVLLCAVGIQTWFAWSLWHVKAVRSSPALRRLVVAAWLALCVWMALGTLISYERIHRDLPTSWMYLVQGTALGWAFFSAALLAGLWLARRVPSSPDPGRRQMLRVVRAAAVSAPLAVAGYGVFLARRQARLREVTVRIPDLPQDLRGLRIVQLTDIHLSPFLSEHEFASAVDLANETRAHLAVVTGDLITRRGDPLDACLRQLSRLRAEAGVLGCLGNHERYARVSGYTAQQGARQGLQFLRRRAVTLPFGAARLHVAGCDYQESRLPYLTGMERLVSGETGTLNLLLSHNPDVFPVAARQGYDLTLAGHTHGGQVTVEVVSQHVNAARFFTPYVDGLYREGRSSAFVSQGIGTVGVPVRLGTRPEVALLTLQCDT